MGHGQEGVSRGRSRNVRSSRIPLESTKEQRQSPERKQRSLPIEFVTLVVKRVFWMQDAGVMDCIAQRISLGSASVSSFSCRLPTRDTAHLRPSMQLPAGVPAK